MKGLSADNSPVFHRLCVEYEQLVDMLSAPQYMLETWGGAFISLLQCGLKVPFAFTSFSVLVLFNPLSTSPRKTLY